jgi:hypothetical protein
MLQAGKLEQISKPFAETLETAPGVQNTGRTLFHALEVRATDNPQQQVRFS